MLVIKIMQVLKNLFGLNKKIAASEIAIKDSNGKGVPLDEFLNTIDVYLTEEKIIGTWMDKPLYRKTFTSDLVEGDNMIYHNIENIGHIFISDKSYIYTNGSHYPANYVNSSDNLGKQYIKTSANTTRIDIFLGGYIISGTTNCAITLEYTKTTD